VTRGDGDELVPLGGAGAVQPVHVGVGQREELVAVGVQKVGRARAEPLVRKLEGPLDLMARRLDPDALPAKMHAASIGLHSRAL